MTYLGYFIYQKGRSQVARRQRKQSFDYSEHTDPVVRAGLAQAMSLSGWFYPLPRIEEEAALVIVIIVKQTIPRLYAVVKDAEEKKILFRFPSGGREETDPDIFFTATRETHEEAFYGCPNNIRVGLKHLIGDVEDNRTGHHVAAIFALDVPTDTLSQKGPEQEHLFWLTGGQIDQLAQGDLEPTGNPELDACVEKMKKEILRQTGAIRSLLSFKHAEGWRLYKRLTLSASQGR